MKPRSRSLSMCAASCGCNRASISSTLAADGEAFPLYAACERQAHAEGITLSREQAETAKRRIEVARLERNCKVHLRDYRELEATDKTFDKIASIGMVEHVGLKNLPLYFGIAHRLLRPGGLFLNHGIARAPLAPVRQSSFIDRYVFPDGRLVTLAQTVSAAESQGFEVRDVENLREHYELTLRRWVEGLTRNADALLKHVSKDDVPDLALVHGGVCRGVSQGRYRFVPGAAEQAGPGKQPSSADARRPVPAK